MREIAEGTITDAVAAYRGCGPDEPFAEGSDPTRLRHLSWDICRLHFSDATLSDKKKHRRLNALHLSAYLASQGMIQGASPLLTSSNAIVFESAVAVLEKRAKKIADLDVDDYAKPKKRKKLLKAHGELSDALVPDAGGTATAASRSMMGAFGCLPGFGGNFTKAMGNLAGRGVANAEFASPTDDSLEFLHQFWSAHRDEIDDLSTRITVVDVAKGSFTDIPVGRARILEMFADQWAAQI
ncbi:hypothetical protein [uncultured Corynebacterium sp.]|uniref:hypothetical protein n=1 Tax=uncultured Corynebacterium sp. TaxID=159447 RepID=UPI0025E6DA7E|nr:hypothetical protein [uncultured Corynebacterium sp.]